MMHLLMPHRVRRFASREPETCCRALLVGEELRFTFMFVTPVSLIGTPLAGWSDVSGASEQFVEWSADQVTWQRRQFVEAREVLRPNGDIEVWCLSRHPLVGPAAVPTQYARLGVHLSRRHRNWR